jgi:hypothetical protein
VIADCIVHCHAVAVLLVLCGGGVALWCFNGFGTPSSDIDNA